MLSGDNGQGKTNVLEAIYAVCALRSFRTSRLRDVIRLGSARATVVAHVRRGGLERIYEMSVGERGRSALLDGKPARPIARYFGDFSVVLFAPEDLLLPRASPADRRRFLDRAIFNATPGHLVAVQDYDKVVRSRNAVLRDERMAADQRAALLDVFDGQLAELGAVLMRARHDYLTTLGPRFAAAFAAITQSGLVAELRYQPAAEGVTPGPDAELTAQLAAAIEGSRRRDLARRATSVGPHRDDLAFVLDGQPAATFASQGQLRALILAWKTAELELLAASHGDPSALLLDDVSSELDAARNEYLFEFLRSGTSQCFITTTDPRHVLLAADRVDFSVRAGRIERRSEAFTGPPE